MTHLVVAMPSGFAACARRPNGGLVPRSEHLTRESAKRECQRLDLMERLEMERARWRGLRQNGMDSRPVRWFEPDQFA